MNEIQNPVDRLSQVALLGVGSMGGAILAGLTASDTAGECEACGGAACACGASHETHPGVRAHPGSSNAAPEAPGRTVAVTTHSLASAQKLAGLPGVTASASEANPAANREAVRGAGLVILAVKPWAVHEVLRDIAPELEPGAIVVSVAAGVTTASMEALLPAHVAVVRAMPNTPSHVGLGVTGLAAGVSATPRDVAAACAVFETVGRVLVVDESRIDAVGSVSGSGPAYLYFFTEAFTGAAERLGFTREEAKLLAEGTIIGAARLLEASGEDPAELRRRVTSPKGTTEQAIAVLETGEWGALFDRALAAAIRRSHELAAG